MRTRRGVIAALVAAVALTACADADPPSSETVASDSVTVDVPTETTGDTDTAQSTQPIQPIQPTQPTTHAPSASQHSAEAVIPADFPLAAGWPTPDGETDVTGPSRALPAFAYSACEETFTEPDHVDRLSAGWKGPEDFRSRQLTTYADLDTSSLVVDELALFYRSCPIGPRREDGYRTEYEVVAVDAGDRAWGVLERDTWKGNETPFGSTTVVVQVGTAVLVLDHGGHAGYPRGNGRRSIDELLDEAAQVVAAMAGLPS